MVVKYLRLGTGKKSMDLRELQLDKLGIKFDKEYIDKLTISSKERPQFSKMVEKINHGDEVYCESISKLGRNLKDLIGIVESLVDKGVRVVIVKEGIDTANSTYKLLLSVFYGVSEMEREVVQERIIHGVEKCKATGETKTGKWFGRKKKKVDDLPEDFHRYYRKMITRKISKVEMAKLLGCGRATLYRWIELYEG